MILRILVATAAFALITFVGIDLITPDRPVTTVETISLDDDSNSQAAGSGNQGSGKNDTKQDDDKKGKPKNDEKKSGGQNNPT